MKYSSARIAKAARSLKFYEAFGEENTLEGWSRDPRCMVGAKCLRERVRDGIPLEDALFRTTRMMRNQNPGRLIEAWGESRSISSWAADPRCQVPEITIRHRLERGISPEEAIGTPPAGLERPIERYDAFGESKTLAEWTRDERCRCSYGTLRARLKMGLGLVEAMSDATLSSEHAPATLYQAFGQSYTLVDWARDSRCTVSVDTLRHRIQSGYSMEEALSGPIGMGELVEAFGERKTVSEWMEDPRTTVTRAALIDRLSRGFSFEEALVQPKSESYRPPRSWVMTAYGESKHIAEWARDPRCEVSDAQLRKRLKNGLPPEEALKADKPYQGRPKYKAFGEEKTLSDWARDPRCVVSISALRDRLIAGEACEEAMTRHPQDKIRSFWRTR